MPALCALWFTGFPHCPRYTVFTVPALIVVHAIHVPIPRRLSACTFGVLYPTPVRGMLSAGATTIRKVDTVRTVRASLDAVRRSWGVPPWSVSIIARVYPLVNPFFKKIFGAIFSLFFDKVTETIYTREKIFSEKTRKKYFFWGVLRAVFLRIPRPDSTAPRQHRAPIGRGTADRVHYTT